MKPALLLTLLLAFFFVSMPAIRRRTIRKAERILVDDDAR